MSIFESINRDRIPMLLPFRRVDEGSGVEVVKQTHQARCMIKMKMRCGDGFQLEIVPSQEFTDSWNDLSGVFPRKGRINKNCFVFVDVRPESRWRNESIRNMADRSSVADLGTRQKADAGGYPVFEPVDT